MGDRFRATFQPIRPSSPETAEPVFLWRGACHERSCMVTRGTLMLMGGVVGLGKARHDRATRAGARMTGSFAKTRFYPTQFLSFYDAGPRAVIVGF